jgi:hypothetical protein
MPAMPHGVMPPRPMMPSGVATTGGAPASAQVPHGPEASLHTNGDALAVASGSATSLLTQHLDTMHALASTLHDPTATASYPAPPPVRFAAAATLALGELERVGGESAGVPDLDMAAAALLTGLWQVAAHAFAQRSDALAPILRPRERHRLESLLDWAPERRATYRRLAPELTRLLCPVPPCERIALTLHDLLLRALTVGAQGGRTSGPWQQVEADEPTGEHQGAPSASGVTAGT